MGAMEDFIREKAKNVKDEDVSWALRGAACIRDKVYGPLARFAKQVRLFINMLRDYRSGEYRDAPVWTIGVIAFSLLYILTPFDCVPDFIPLAGLVDDALVMAASIAMIGQDIRDYEQWRDRKDAASAHREDDAETETDDETVADGAAEDATTADSEKEA